MSRVREHYAVEVPVEAVRQHTLRHGKAIATLAAAAAAKPATQLITQMDGSMIPVMQPGSGADARKGRSLFWREVRLCSARPEGQAAALYGAALGSAETASWLWRATAQSAGLGDSTRVHGVGDGAPWIVDKFQENFGEQGRYLLDFYHVSEYLAAAAQVIKPKNPKRWRQRQQGRLLENKVARPATAPGVRNRREPTHQHRLSIPAQTPRPSGLRRGAETKPAHRIRRNRKRPSPNIPTPKAFGAVPVHQAWL